MSANTQILEQLISEDFGLESKDGSRWGKGEDHDSLVLDKERGLFFWNSKGIVGDTLVYLTRVRKYSFEKARKYLEQYENFVSTQVYTVDTDYGDTVVYPRLVEVFFDLGKSKENREYMYNRGITDETIDRFQVGWYNEYTMIPFFVNGTFRNFQMRMEKPIKKIKKYYKAKPLMFNSDILKITNTIFFTEGPIDAMALIQNGLPAISTDFSGNVLPEWYGKFLNQTDIILLFDNDKAGVTEAIKTAKVLGVDRCKIYTFQDFDEPSYDPVDFFKDGNTKEELLDLINEKGKYSYEF